MKFILIILLSLSSLENAVFALPQMMGHIRVQTPSELPYDIRMKRKYFADVMLKSPQDLGQGYGASITIGYQPSIVGYDLRFTYGSMHFSQFYSTPTYVESGSGGTQPAAIANFRSDINEAYRRKFDASWSYMQIEPGISVIGRLIPTQKLTQIARFGIAKSSFSDPEGTQSYSGWVFDTEALIRYSFSPASPLSIQTGLSYNWGWISHSEPADLPSIDRRLPIHYLNYIMGIHYAL